MAGSDFTFNIAKGKVAYYVENLVNAGTGRLIVVLLINDGAIVLESDDDMKDHTTLASLLSSNTEAEPNSGSTAGARITNYDRHYILGTDPNLGASPSNPLDEMDADTSDLVWLLFGNGANQHIVGKLVFAYDGAHNTLADGSITTTSTGLGHGFGAETDSACVPLTAHSFDVTPDGSNISALITNFFKAVDG